MCSQKYTQIHSQVCAHSVRSQLSASASQFIKPNPRDWTEEFKWEPPLPFLWSSAPFKLTVAVVALQISNRYNTPTLSLIHSPSRSFVCGLSCTFERHMAVRADTNTPVLPRPWPWGGGNKVLNPEIVYKCKSDKNPPCPTPTRPTFVRAL